MQSPPCPTFSLGAGTLKWGDCKTSLGEADGVPLVLGGPMDCSQAVGFSYLSLSTEADFVVHFS